MSEATRITFSGDISGLEQDLLWMGSVVEQALHHAVDAFTSPQAARVDEATHLDNTIDHCKAVIEAKCYTLLARQQPMARDLRTLTSIIKISGELERAGDYAVEVTFAAAQLTLAPPQHALWDISPMSHLLKRIARGTLAALAEHDLALVVQVIHDEQATDRLYPEMMAKIIGAMREQPAFIHDGVSLLNILHSLERLADHFATICSRVYFMETGETLPHEGRNY